VEGSSTLPDTGPLEWAKPMPIALEMFVFDIEAMLQWCYCIGHLMKYLYRLITCCCFLVLFVLVACFYVAILSVQVDTKQWTNTPKHILFNSHFFQLKLRILNVAHKAEKLTKLTPRECSSISYLSSVNCSLYPDLLFCSYQRNACIVSCFCQANTGLIHHLVYIQRPILNFLYQIYMYCPRYFLKSFSLITNLYIYR